MAEITSQPASKITSLSSRRVVRPRKPAQRITEKALAALMKEPPAKGYRVIWDTEPGFGARITASGRISFILIYRFKGGPQQSYTIAQHPYMSLEDARVEAGNLKKKMRDPDNPINPLDMRKKERQDRKSAPTIADLAQEYLDMHAVNKRSSSQRNDRQMINRLILPYFNDGKTRLDDIASNTVQKLHNSLRTTPYQANRVLSLLSKMFNLAVEWEWEGMKKNVAKNVPRFDEPKREGFLDTAQLQDFRHALDIYEDQNAADALRLLMLTGSRASEVMKSEWKHFDLNRGVWTKPSHHTKQKKTEHVPLSKPALELLLRMKPKNATGPLFPGKEKDGETEKRARTTLRNPWVQACRAAGLAEETTIKRGKRKGEKRYRPTVRIHDLRHSFASHLVSKGVGLYEVGTLLGHTEAETTKRYAHLQDRTLRDATNVFGDIYSETATPKTGTR